MTTLFGGLAGQVNAAEAATDNLGSGRKVYESGIYKFVGTALYVGKAKSGADFMQLIGKLSSLDGIEQGEYREQAYFTSGTDKGNKPTYEKDGKNYFLPGYSIVSDLLLMTTGQPLPSANFEEKLVNVYDFDQKKELPKSVMTAVDALGEPVLVAILKTEEDVNEKDANGNYVPTGKTRFSNNIEKVFHEGFRLTVVEAEQLEKAGKEPTIEDAIFFGAWAEKNTGQTRSKVSKGTGKAGAAPTPGGNAAPAGGSAKKLFGK